ncbi:MlaD family protein [Nocardia yamanashiensis]|uniref:MlaD family protein n=1 Tax=Nocardia yamanashiensis TaxID=209247 RepID=UPI001E4618F1|nr:MlaD family protein [Nocardia yamanashiensis]UGT42464.1 MlaD family protein [Nocardia yamanashiensis]
MNTPNPLRAFRGRVLPRTRTGRLTAGVGVVALVMGLIVALTGKQYYDTTQAPLSICAEFRDAVGLYEGNKVTMLGIQIGNVESIEPSDQGVVVRMTVDRKVRLPQQLGAVTVANSIVTDRRVELGPAYTSGGTFDYRNCIPKDRTKTPVGFTEAMRAVATLSEDLTGKAHDAPLQEAPPNVLGDSLARIAQQVDDSAVPLNGAIRNVSEILGDSAAGANYLLGAILKEFRKISQNLDQGVSDSEFLLDAATDALNIANRIAPDLTAIIRDISIWMPPLANLLGYKWIRTIMLGLDGFMPVLFQILDHTQGLVDFAKSVPDALQGAKNLFDQNLGAGKLQYVPPSFRIDPALARDVCSMVKPWYQPCDRDFAAGETVDLGLVQLLLSAGGK